MPSHPPYPSRSLKHFLLSLTAFALICLAASSFAQTPAATAPASATPAATTPATTPVATPAAPSKPATTSGVVGDHNTQLSDSIPADQQLQLQAGDDKFSARYIADLSPEHRGAVIVLHDSGQHQSWPFTVAALLDDLPQFGWSTLAIELPAPAQDAINKTPTTNAANTAAPIAPPTAPATGTPPAVVPTTGDLITGSEEGIEKQTQARIDAALKKLAELNQGNPQATVLIGFGSGAWREVEFARKQALGNGAKSAEPLRALVLIDARNQFPATTTDLPKLLPTTELAALDIVQSSEAIPRAEAEARRRAVLHQKNRIYQQLFLPPLNARNATEQTLLVKRIRSWIQKNVQANEQKKPKTP